MLILAVESSAAPASAAVMEDDKLLGEFFVNTKQTHSQTLLPMVTGLLQSLGKRCEEFDLMAVSSGPGSFTGVRIGISCVKGLAFSHNTPCCGISTLETIATGGVSYEDGTILCAVMDARCGQVYNALFRCEGGTLLRLTEDRALSIADLSRECSSYGEHLVLLGDGASLCYESFREWGARLASEAIRYQRASSVARIAKSLVGTDRIVSAAGLLPAYLRLPQAERELKKKLEKGERGE